MDRWNPLAGIDWGALFRGPRAGLWGEDGPTLPSIGLPAGDLGLGGSGLPDVTLSGFLPAFDLPPLRFDLPLPLSGWERSGASLGYDLGPTVAERRQARTSTPARAGYAGPDPAGTGAGRWREMIDRVAGELGMDADLLEALVEAESGGNERAVSGAGAQGLTQLMPATARGLGVADAFDPEQNLRGGARYLKQQLDRYGGDMDRALAAYNAGPGAVDRYGGIPPFRETQAYVPKVKGFYDGIRARRATPGGTAVGIEQAVQVAAGQIGKPYVWGGADERGFDCSGLVQYAFGKAGFTVPRTAQGQYDATTRVTAAQLRPGDLVFYQGTYDAGRDWVTHVGIWDGQQVIMAPTEGSRIKRVPLNHAYWGAHLAGYGRVARG